VFWTRPLVLDAVYRFYRLFILGCHNMRPDPRYLTLSCCFRLSPPRGNPEITALSVSNYSLDINTHYSTLDEDRLSTRVFVEDIMLVSKSRFVTILLKKSTATRTSKEQVNDSFVEVKQVHTNRWFCYSISFLMLSDSLIGW